MAHTMYHSARPARSYSDQTDRRSYVLPLLAVLAALLLGFILYRAASTNTLPAGSGNSSNAVSPAGTENSNGGIGNSNSSDALNFQRAVVQYAQLLPETARESVDAPSPEGVAAQDILNQQTGIIARSIAGNVKGANGQEVSEASITSLMAAFNKSVIDYTAAQQATNAVDDHGAVDAAANNIVAALSANGQNKTKLTNMFTSYKNAVLESTRNFAQGNYAASYQKQLESERTATQLFALVRG